MAVQHEGGNATDGTESKISFTCCTGLRLINETKIIMATIGIWMEGRSGTSGVVDTSKSLKTKG